jgi:hypothetical protein
MNTRRLREYLEKLEGLRDRHRDGGDPDGADKLEGLLERLRELADDADDVFRRLGNPPTDP